MTTAAAIAPRRVEVVAGLDEAQVRAAYALHSAWAAEQGDVMDDAGWAEQMKAAVGSGRMNLWVAWDGDEAVGVAEMHLVYDPLTSTTAAYGERAFVQPEYRRSGVFEAITESMIAFADGLGIKTQRMSAGSDIRGRGMEKFYARYGFRPISTLMGKNG